MEPSSLPDMLGPELSSALFKKGYTALTAVQSAVLDPELSGRDLRITSQTGSGKTVAIGLTLREFLQSEPGDAAPPWPRGLVVAPTRELAKQVEEELSWLYEPLGVRVVAVTGGASYRDERRALAGNPGVVVGTPGRLLDHLQRKSFDPAGLGAVVLDEADRLLDLGFREDLDAILAFAPEGHRTHLVSATFPREVKALADATQDDPVHVEGTRLGEANADIDHVVHLVDSRDRLAALVNILLANPEEQTLVFARTRADVAAIAQDLRAAGFAVNSLSGEMDQTARNRAMAAFKNGDLRVLVATDVAARGIDVQDIARVIHAEPPSDADSYTHRSGRTGRAGRKGTSAVLAISAQLARTTFLLSRAGVPFRFEPIPTADAIRAAADERMVVALLGEDTSEAHGFDERTWALAKRITSEGDATRAIARLLTKARYAGPTEPRAVRHLEPPGARPKGMRDRHAPERGGRPASRDARGGPTARDAREYAPREYAPRGAREYAPRDAREYAPRDAREYAPREARDRRPPRDERGAGRDGGWVPFHVTWGERDGADARRLLAAVCRRGGIRGSDVGSIRVGPSHSTVDVAAHAADAFAQAAGAPDPRDPGVVIRREGSPGRAPMTVPPPSQGPPPSPAAPPRREAVRTPLHVERRPSRAAADEPHPHKSAGVASHARKSTGDEPHPRKTAGSDLHPRKTGGGDLHPRKTAGGDLHPRKTPSGESHPRKTTGGKRPLKRGTHSRDS
ncbi:MAG TPA: DEAD/DEAH box helicase [Polyangiaceae bacterium]|jgi:ATP-dependent RNA helicase DeaD|nr:DEAD/DEAH box helicase [Polyangiaceae bacterium]